ncbi:MAG: hypothetical protein ACI81T_002448 [Bacteroidia bacterium]|jgi:uncharacterized protein (DUF2147 family)
MKKSIYLILFAIIPLLAASTFKSSMRKGDEDLIVGRWKPSNGRSVVSIYKGKSENGEDTDKYYGKIIWLKQPNDDKGKLRKDVNNSDDELKKKTVKGLVIIKKLEFEEIDGKTITWSGGTIYDPNNGSEYSFEAEINKKNADTMSGRGFIGVALFGRTDTWTRLVRK